MNKSELQTLLNLTKIEIYGIEDLLSRIKSVERFYYVGAVKDTKEGQQHFRDLNQTRNGVRAIKRRLKTLATISKKLKDEIRA